MLTLPSGARRKNRKRHTRAPGLLPHVRRFSGEKAAAAPVDDAEHDFEDGPVSGSVHVVEDALEDNVTHVIISLHEGRLSMVAY